MHRLLLLSVLLFSCTSKPDNAKCEQLVNHIVDLRTAGKTDANTLNQTLVSQVGQATKEFCLENLSMQQIECGLKSQDFAAITACDPK